MGADVPDHARTQRDEHDDGARGLADQRVVEEPCRRCHPRPQPEICERRSRLLGRESLAQHRVCLRVQDSVTHPPQTRRGHQHLEGAMSARAAMKQEVKKEVVEDEIGGGGRGILGFILLILSPLT